MLHSTQIIKKPLVTEKCAWEGAARNRVSFVVDLRANKYQIRQAIEETYGVRVQKVSTQIRKDAARRTRHGISGGRAWKKATVQVHPEDKIDLF